MDFSETFEPQIKSWQEEDKDKRSVIFITLEDAGEGKHAAGVSIMGNGFNIAYSIAEALNGSDDLKKLFSTGVKLASMMKLEEIKKATKEVEKEL
ncbi:hypothetical protein [Alloprevotella tannerae]|uniref:hypothetical protein n=1 Tax=Alloprevotella tannerae TaxID=76122 RepID=UPI00288A4EF6|nr:hypothetical protein [Alloprevotella tannerae]